MFFNFIDFWLPYWSVVKTSPRATHVVHVGDLVPAGTRLVTPGWQDKRKLVLTNLFQLATDFYWQLLVGSLWHIVVNRTFALISLLVNDEKNWDMRKKQNHFLLMGSLSLLLTHDDKDQVKVWKETSSPATLHSRNVLIKYWKIKLF